MSLAKMEMKVGDILVKYTPPNEIKQKKEVNMRPVNDNEIKKIASRDAGHGDPAKTFEKIKTDRMNNLKDMKEAQQSNGSEVFKERTILDVIVGVLFGIPLVFGLYFFLDDLYDLSNPVTEIVAIKCTAFTLLAFVIQGYLLNRLINLIYKPLKLVGNGLSKIFRKK